jgi:alpha-D-xyloside xylohydrolase
MATEFSGTTIPAAAFNNRFANYLYISSEVADVIDYYFFYGPELDKVIASYRELTGQAPMFGKWAYGFWQCKNRYKSQEEILGVARKYRELHIPVDNIVQDWFWWNRKGEFVFNKNYPDPKGMIDELHRENFHLMISIWPFFEPGSANYDFMEKKGWFVDKFKFAKPPYHTDAMAVYDATNPEARKFYWEQVDKGLFSLGADAWWMDTTEPETEGQEENIQLGHKLADGSGDRLCEPVSDARPPGQCMTASAPLRQEARLHSFALGLCRIATQRRNGMVRRHQFRLVQLPPADSRGPQLCALRHSLLDDRYWRLCFRRPHRPGLPRTFCPLVSVRDVQSDPAGARHAQARTRTSCGRTARKRRRFWSASTVCATACFPYTYSLAWQTTNSSYTPMRPLVMDFRSDVRAQNTWDEFMYGPAFLVNPVTEPAAVERQVYLPDAKWYDFWSGMPASTAGTQITAEAPLARLPLYVRAGAIVPLGPDVEWSTEKAADPIELRVYRGADGGFTLYEDENDNYNYEKGIHATIPFHWDDAGKVLTIGERQGQFPGMLANRTFRVVFVGENHGVGVALSETADKTVQYSGKDRLRLRRRTTYK